MEVHGRDGNKIGTIDRLVLDKMTGEVAFVVLSSGGFLGLGQAYHPIPWPAFRYDSRRDGYVVAIDKRLLEGSPTYRPDTAPVFDEVYGQRVREYYRASLDGAS
nr:PRC-barrel domain-containing protein [Sphingomonas quercus]